MSAASNTNELEVSLLLETPTLSIRSKGERTKASTIPMS